MNPAFQVVPPSLDTLPRATDRNFKQLTDLMRSWDRSFGPVGDLSVTGNASIGGNLSVTGSSAFTGPASFAGAATFNAGMRLVGTTTVPRILFRQTDGGIDKKVWDIDIVSETFKLRTYNDAEASAYDVMTINRTGITPTMVAFNSPVTVANKLYVNSLQVNAADFRSVSDNNYFGAGALGATGTYLNIGSLGDPSNVYADANGTPANVGIAIRSKGTGQIAFQINHGSGAYIDGTNLGFYANGIGGTTHESRRRDAQASVSGYGFSYSSDNTPHAGGGTAGLAIAVNRGDPAAVFRNANTSGSAIAMGVITNDGNWKFYISCGENSHLQMANIYLGKYGNYSGCRLYVNSGDQNTFYLQLQSSAANCHWFFQGVGTGIYRFYDGAGQYMLDIRGVSEVTAQQTSLWLYWVSAGGSAMFTKVLAVPNVIPGFHALCVQ